ncbi:50S ribosomal protein L4 [Methylotuvimicrobium alcaliphilum]|jgi:large subunit ribosomal protein L4|uniref:Large ribosomal subunit protein uL4 n=1 Tax=Methylotuvimicrobium alcaliphilum (strain DSM 19304 / NCIMB 14124 / VKM B-2133 / 20Z) TaxID=1091494 RepID=G4STL7_META2|nr:50S ribosomal protein L4 [Methylotuvimicrobium alcaliphilum]CCE25015.1 50S ribosomal subunit protein L4 [Methylotuvimicrobium alcaliphilum 20Z]
MSIQIPAINESESAAAVAVGEEVFGQVFNETLVHQLVTRHLAGARSGTKAQKTRSDVSGGGIKPWRQKGTGRARSGTMRSPLWRTGGVTFAARPRSFEQKLNKKMFRSGLRSILSELLRQDRLVVSSEIIPSTPKTKEMVAKLSGLDCKRVLIISDEVDFNLALASRNIPYLEVCSADNLSPVSLVAAEKVIMTPAAVKMIEERLA